MASINASTSGAGGVITTADNTGILNIQTASTTAVTVNASQNVGIGTTSPASKLDVTFNSANADGIQLKNNNNAAYTTLNVSGSSGYGVSGWANSTVLESVPASTGGLVLSSYTGNIIFQTNNRAERMRIDSSGNLLFNSGYGSAATAYGCRAWVNFNGTGTVAIRASGNVTSITDNGTGDYTINFTTAMPDINYSYSGFGGQNIDGGYIQVSRNAAPTTSALRIEAGSIPGVFNPRDASYVTVAVFR
jgi:hypothetical protein